MKMLVGFIYSYFVKKRCVYVGQTVNVKNRHRSHKNSRNLLSDLIKTTSPTVLETVEGIDETDLRFNLTFQETVWIFKLKTYQPSFGPNVFNLVIPKMVPVSDSTYRSKLIKVNYNRVEVGKHSWHARLKTFDSNCRMCRHLLSPPRPYKGANRENLSKDWWGSKSSPFSKR